MANSKIERVRGVNDVLPREYRAMRHIQDTLQATFERFGYAPLELPVIEHTDLYLKKSGEEIIARMYDFQYRSRRLCLRPEMTASVMRAYIDNLQNEPLPLRLHYSGPVFRYEKPQKARYRQFTQMGVELIGASQALADAEVIRLAYGALQALGLKDFRAVIGHVGILSRFLQNLKIDSRLRSFLLQNMEAMQKKGSAFVTERLRQIYPAFEDSSAQTMPRSQRLTALFQEMDEAEARLAVLDFLQNINIHLEGSRDADEIIARLLTKIRRRDQTPGLQSALRFMDEISRLSGSPAAVLPEAEKILASYAIDRSALDALRELVRALEHYGLGWEHISLDLGLSRGLQYYTGTIFEVHHGGLGEERQLCGGGRYDDLIATLGGLNDIPATGFAFGLERLHLALESEGGAKGGPQPLVRALIAAIDAQDFPYAVETAERLRAHGVPVELDVRQRSVKSNLQYADKRGIAFVVLIGPTERAAGEVVLRAMDTRQEKRVRAEEVYAAMQQMRGENDGQS
ncbi:MAG: ATP phosphoribosyltransferase regulatory subunit [Chloroflexi bacterium]|nr:ATP phosphoribosyltransferase regulatory subunit [Chloroflexota bacterium]